MVLSEKVLLGKVDDVFGPVEQPFYVVYSRLADEMLMPKKGDELFTWINLASQLLNPIDLVDPSDDLDSSSDNEEGQIID